MMYTVQALDKQDGHDDGDDDEKDSDDDDDLKINQEDSPKLSFSLAKSHWVDQKNDGADEGPLEVTHGAHEGPLDDADDSDIYI